jgi:hypothetical protein
MVMYLHPETTKFGSIIEPVSRGLMKAGNDGLAVGNHVDARGLGSVVVGGKEESDMFGEDRRMGASSSNVGGDSASATVCQYLDRCCCRDGELGVSGIFAGAVCVDRVIRQPLEGVLGN